jgi:hypothetical protein
VKAVTVKNSGQCGAGALAGSGKEQPGAAVPHFSSSGVVKYGHESLACAISHPLEKKRRLQLAARFFGVLGASKGGVLNNSIFDVKLV